MVWGLATRILQVAVPQAAAHAPPLEFAHTFVLLSSIACDIAAHLTWWVSHYFAFLLCCMQNSLRRVFQKHWCRKVVANEKTVHVQHAWAPPNPGDPEERCCKSAQ